MLAARPMIAQRAMICILFCVGAAIGGGDGDGDRMQRLAGERYGTAGAESVRAWRRMIADAQSLDDLGKLRWTNTFFNRRIFFDDDIVIWKRADYWATPLETLGRGAGDCEDFSIAKYMTLRLLGIPADKLRLIYVRAQIGGLRGGRSLAHMVVGFYASPQAEPLVLDNLIGEIRPATRRPDLFPVFSFNTDGLWVGGSTASSADPTIRLSRWRSVLERMREEGLE